MTASVSGGVLQDVGTVGFIGTVGTISSAISVSPVAAVGTVGTLQSGNVTASIASGVLQYVGSIGTIINPVTVSQAFTQTNIATNAVITSATVGTLAARSLQDLVVDVVYGTVVTGSIITSVIGVEPQTGIQTSTIVAGSWFAGTLVAGQRLVAKGPLGALVAISTYVATAGTINAGTATGVYVTAEQSTTK